MMTPEQLEAKLLEFERGLHKVNQSILELRKTAEASNEDKRRLDRREMIRELAPVKASWIGVACKSNRLAELLDAVDSLDSSVSSYDLEAMDSQDAPVIVFPGERCRSAFEAYTAGQITEAIALRISSNAK